MSKSKINAIISLILNLFVVVSVCYGVSTYFTTSTGEGNMNVVGVECFKFFTIDSNILVAITSLIVLIFDILILVNKYEELPKWVIYTKHVGVAAITLTFLVVMCYLGPVQGFDKMLGQRGIFSHLMNPLAAIFSYLFFEHSVKEKYKYTFLGMIPVILYGSVYLTLVVGTSTWDDFYSFNINGMWYISLIAIIVVSYLISLGLNALHNLIYKKLYLIKNNDNYDIHIDQK